MFAVEENVMSLLIGIRSCGPIEKCSSPMLKLHAYPSYPGIACPLCYCGSFLNPMENYCDLRL